MTKRQTSLKPQVELLERKQLLACSIVQNGAILTVDGDNKANTITIDDDDLAGTVTVTCDNDVPQVFNTPISIIQVRSGNQNDHVTYNLTSGLAAGEARIVTVGMGNGKDEFDATLDGKLGGTLALTAHGGTGKDDLAADAIGLDLTSNSAMLLNLGGGPSTDIINAHFEGVLAGSLAFNAFGSKSSDILTADFLLKTGSAGALSASVNGGESTDALTLTVRKETEADTASIIASLEGGSSDDVGTHTANVTSDCEQDNVVV